MNDHHNTKIELVQGDQEELRSCKQPTNILHNPKNPKLLNFEPKMKYAQKKPPGCFLFVNVMYDNKH